MSDRVDIIICDDNTDIEHPILHSDKDAMRYLYRLAFERSIAKSFVKWMSGADMKKKCYESQNNGLYLPELKVMVYRTFPCVYCGRYGYNNSRSDFCGKCQEIICTHEWRQKRPKEEWQRIIQANEQRRQRNEELREIRRGGKWQEMREKN